jgi:hypothetical protein
MGSVMRWQLVEHVLCLSNAATWETARQEWEVSRTWWDETPGRCVCGHYPIFEHCELRNVENGLTTIVGNCCVKLFVSGAPKLFSGIGRIRKDPNKAPNSEVIRYAVLRGLIGDWERGFLIETERKRCLTEKQRLKRIEINQKILANQCQGIEP